MRFTIFLLLLSALLPVFLPGQPYYFKHFKVEDGLSHNTVLCSFQDSKGFMWFGTKSGLNRFDGYTFKVFQEKPGGPKSLPGIYVRSLHEYEDVWVGMDDGLYRYDEEHEDFELVPITKNRSIWDINHDAAGNLWFITGDAAYKYHLESGQISTYPVPSGDWYTNVSVLINGQVLITGTQSLYFYEEQAGTFQKRQLEVEESAKKPFRISEVLVFDPTIILLGTPNHGLLAYDLKSGNISNFLPTQERIYVRAILRKDQEIWVGSESGIHIYDTEKRTYVNQKKNYNDPYALSDNAVYTLSLDREGGVWAGTYFGGVNYYGKPYTPFRKYFPKPSENSISGNAVREIHPDQYGNIWIGTEDGGLNKYDPQRDEFTLYTSRDRGGVLSHFNVHAVLPLGDKVWVGMFEHGLDILDINTGKVVKHYDVGDRSGLRSNFVYHLYQTRSGDIYAVTTSGIQRYDAAQDQFILVDAFPANIGYKHLMEDQQGMIWAASSWNGVYYFHPKTGEKGAFKWDESNEKSISDNNINAIFEDSEQRLWVATENDLNLLDRNTASFERFTVEDGFPSNVFFDFIEDRNKTLWITTVNGLVAYDPISRQKKIYTAANGLLTNQFNYNSAYQDESGRLYFGSVKGMISFDPEEIVLNTYQPPIYITGIKINNEAVPIGREGSPLKRSVSFTKSITLTHRQSSFSLDFAALSYTAPEMTEYWYQLGGLNEEWIPLGKQHEVFFTELAAGDYHFKVKSINNGGVWNEETSALRIKVLPPFWKSNLAYAFYAVAIGLLAYLIFRYYDQRTKARNQQVLRELNIKKEKEVFQAKIEFFTNVSHEIRTPLTLIKSPLDKLLKKVKSNSDVHETLSIMHKNTSRLLDLVNQLLDFRKSELEHTDLTFVKLNISDLVRHICTRFSPSIKDKKLDLTMQGLHEPVHAYADAEAMKKILSNLIGNAVKYAEKKVVISLQQKEGCFELGVVNDGPLIPTHLAQKIFEPFYRVPAEENRNQSGTGIGLALAHSLAELHHGSLLLDTTSRHLNCFVLRLPLRQEKEFPLYLPDGREMQADVDRQYLELAVSGNKPSILLVEDNLDLLDFIAKDLVEEYLVVKATQAEAALGMLREEKVQLVVSDVMMPGMDGFALCKNIKTSLEFSHIPVVLLTAKSALQSKIDGLESGADAYIEKPFSMDHLKAQIANLLANRRHILEHFSSSPLAHIRSIAQTEVDEDFIKKLDETMSRHLSDPNLNVETLAEIMHMSRSTLYRKIKEMSDLSPNELINIARLKKAAELLKKGDYKIYQIAEMVGYNSQTSFGRNFQKQFNMTPSEYVRS